MLGDLLQAHIRQLFEWVLPACLRFVRKSVKEIQPSLDTSLAIACMRLFSSLLDEFRPSGPEEAPMPPKGTGAQLSNMALADIAASRSSFECALVHFCLLLYQQALALCHKLVVPLWHPVPAHLQCC